MSGISTTPDYNNLPKSRTITEVIPTPTPEPNKLIVELTNLSEGSMRTIKRELKVLIEDYAWKTLISGCVNVTEGK